MVEKIWENMQIEDLPGEEWRDVVGYEGLYQVSNLGRVKSLNYKRSGKAQILEQSKVGKGYLHIQLFKNGKMDQQYVHRLVAQAFISNPYNLPQVNHKTEDKTMNCIECIEWCDPIYNIHYGTAIERMTKNMTGPKKSKPVLCVETGVVYPSSKEASRQTGAGQRNINSCCRGKYGCKTAKGYHWQYAENNDEN